MIIVELKNVLSIYISFYITEKQNISELKTTENAITTPDWVLGFPVILSFRVNLTQRSKR